MSHDDGCVDHIIRGDFPQDLNAKNSNTSSIYSHSDNIKYGVELQVQRQTAQRIRFLCAGFCQKVYKHIMLIFRLNFADESALGVKATFLKIIKQTLKNLFI